ncbi:exodeoxyribonuclease III [Bartonella sp. HY329]|uniref:exodeoxyribonuclease III n=1 Tax=unclassified Bartonella TaxID=2645622 RepID=UPI0021C8D978|nr:MULTISPECIES: exodeoxyribonuclease III [unclassified Bartonella]UXM94145.1 exodeoxyribonuclease III [Bartonella sp. HY329]UXN08467.1 exodeoxyribonuclease III [Bartonella sp. HY328]
MKIATWNINGVKARIENLLVWLKQDSPDIVCLQEIKSIDEAFPRSQIEDLGYHVETHGQKSFNGVALLSKKSPDEVLRGLPGNDSDEQARFIEGVFSTATGPIRVASLYLPNGNPVDTEKYPYKLAWMEHLANLTKERLTFEEPFILAGDYNVITNPIDAKSPEKWINDALYLPQTKAAFRKIINLGMQDVIRMATNDPVYSFWDYQAGAWPKNEGIRIDHFLASPEAIDKITACGISKSLRGWDKPSDHVPVWIDIKD